MATYIETVSATVADAISTKLDEVAVTAESLKIDLKKLDEALKVIKEDGPILDELKKKAVDAAESAAHATETAAAWEAAESAFADWTNAEIAIAASVVVAMSVVLGLAAHQIYLTNVELPSQNVDKRITKDIADIVQKAHKFTVDSINFREDPSTNTIQNLLSVYYGLENKIQAITIDIQNLMIKDSQDHSTAWAVGITFLSAVGIIFSGGIITPWVIPIVVAPWWGLAFSVSAGSAIVFLLAKALTSEAGSREENMKCSLSTSCTMQITIADGRLRYLVPAIKNNVNLQKQEREAAEETLKRLQADGHLCHKDNIKENKKSCAVGDK
jgi:hypothetical protein